MDVWDAIETRIEVREYADDPVDDAVKRRVLEAARLSPSGKNVQHWRFVLVEDGDRVEELADVSATGGWVAGADFAVVVCTDPDYAFAELDAGRAVTHMQLAAWEEGVGSCIYTGFDDDEMARLLDLPAEFRVSLVAGFGHPAREVRGRKDRRPLEELAFSERFGERLDL